MEILVKKSEIGGEFIAPPSKSITHRFLICASLAKGKSTIHEPLICEDTIATINGLRKVGVKISLKKKEAKIEGKEIRASKNIDCKDSGTTLRFLTGVCSLADGESSLIGSERLMRRPIKPLLNALNKVGAWCKKKENIVIVKGRVKGGKVEMRGDISSQFVSSLLLISPLMKKGIDLIVTNLESKPYVELTIDAQQKFGIEIKNEKMEKFKVNPQFYKSTNLKVEGDWSSSSFFLAAGALTGKLRIKNLNLNSLQADKKIVEALNMMGVQLETKSSELIVEKAEKLFPIRFDVSNCPDIFPIICILCAFAKGKSVIEGIERLKFKESDRIKAMIANLMRAGVKAKIENHHFLIESKGRVNPCTIDSFNDHRIAMAFGIMGLVSNGILIRNAECVKKSFPTFWTELKRIGGEIVERKCIR